MKKIFVSVLIISIFMLFSINSCSAIQINKSNSNPNYSFTLDVQENVIGYKLTTELTYNEGEEDYLTVGDTGCNIYNEDDELVWTSYKEEGAEIGLGKGSKITTTNFWTGKDNEGNYVETGRYKIVGIAGIYEDNEYTPIETDPEYVELEKVKSKRMIFDFLNNLLNSLLSF